MGVTNNSITHHFLSKYSDTPAPACKVFVLLFLCCLQRNLFFRTFFLFPDKYYFSIFLWWFNWWYFLFLLTPVPESDFQQQKENWCSSLSRHQSSTSFIIINTNISDPSLCSFWVKQFHFKVYISKHLFSILQSLQY